jgi:NADH-quinone oxidoreductase subunit E
MPEMNRSDMDIKSNMTRADWSAETLLQMKELTSHYPEGKEKSALVPILHIVQEENGGWLDTETMDRVAQFLNIAPIEVYEVATFYSQFNLERVGKHVLEVCRTGPCCLEGAQKMIDFLEKRLGIKDGETTPDGRFTIKTVECLGACGYAPVMQVGDKYYEHLDELKIEALLMNLNDDKE